MARGDFLGMPSEVLRAIGGITLAAAGLEFTIHLMAVDLKIPPKKKQASSLLKDIRRTAQEGLPEHARVSNDLVEDWTHRAGEALRKRHIPVHSLSAKQMTESSWTDVLIHIRSGTVSDADPDQLLDDANNIAALINEGKTLVHGLRHNPRPGVYLPNAVYNERWQPICNTDVGGADMARPTAQELDAWWRMFGPIPVIGDDG